MFNVFTRLSSLVRNLRTIVSDGLSFFAGVWRRRTALAAENLFLRKQLALFREREKNAMHTVNRYLPFSSSSWTGTASHILIKCSTFRSTIRRATHCISSQCGIVSKYLDRSASTTSV